MTVLPPPTRIARLVAAVAKFRSLVSLAPVRAFLRSRTEEMHATIKASQEMRADLAAMRERSRRLRELLDGMFLQLEQDRAARLALEARLDARLNRLDQLLPPLKEDGVAPIATSNP